MNVANVKVETTNQKQVFFNELVSPMDKIFLGIQNIDDQINLGSFLPKKNEFLPTCVDVSKETDVKMKVSDNIKKAYNSNTNYIIKVTLEIELED